MGIVSLAVVSDFSAAALELSAAASTPPSHSLFNKSKAILSKFMSNPLVSTVPFDEDEEPLNINVASVVTVTKNFLSKEETALYRRNENKYQRKPAVGFSGNRMWGGAHLLKSFMRKLIEEGGEQCPSEEYEKSLPSGVSILTNHVTETTDAHVDYNPTTLERIQNDVGVVFLNSNPDATFLVGDEEYPVEEGTLLMFPGGSVPHHIEMKEKDVGFVHMLGPFEVGGSHGTVGAVIAGYDWWFVESTQKAVVDLTTTKARRVLQVEGDEQGSTNTSSTANQYWANITGKIIVTGFADGIDSNGNTNHTLEVAYKIGGLGDLSCSIKECLHVEIKDDPAYCDGVEIGQLENDEPDPAEVVNHIILNIQSLLGNMDEAGVAESMLENVQAALGNIDINIGKILSLLGIIDESGFAEGVGYIDIGKPVSHFFDTPMALHHHDGTILACSIFTEVKADDGAGAGDGSAAGGTTLNDITSGGSSSNVSLSTTLALLSSAVALIISTI